MTGGDLLYLHRTKNPIVYHRSFNELGGGNAQMTGGDLLYLHRTKNPIVYHSSFNELQSISS